MTEIYYIVRNKKDDKDVYWINESKYLCVTFQCDIEDKEIVEVIEKILPNLLLSRQDYTLKSVSLLDFDGERLYIPPKDSELETLKYKLKICIIDIEENLDGGISSKIEGDNGLSIVKCLKPHGSLYFC